VRARDGEALRQIRVSVAAAGKADHPHAAGDRGLHTQRRVLDHNAVRGRFAHRPRGVKEKVGCRFSSGHLDGAVYRVAEQGCQAGDFER
jgi:hypothetical protein